MTDFRFVTDNFAVSPQIALDDVATAARQGFTVIINNRPDGEAPDQPSAAAIEAAARDAGISCVHIPVTGRPTADQAEAVARTAEGERTLAFCRSGTRSIVAWSLGQAAAGTRGREELLRLAASASYDLSGVLAGS